MITPLMLLLSSIGENFECDAPIDTLYLSKADREVISGEANRLGQLVCDEEKILTTQDMYGVDVVDTAQVINDRVVEISLSTAMLLTRLRECYKVFLKCSIATSKEDEDVDLGTDAVILRLEGNPKYVYIYVYTIMESEGLDYSEKIRKILELYVAIVSHMTVVSSEAAQSALQGRLALQSTVQFWQYLLMSDMLKHGYVGQVVSSEDIEVVKSELSSMGFYGFVNPLEMYREFSGARVLRKVGINVEPEVVRFLEKVVKSGGF